MAFKKLCVSVVLLLGPIALASGSLYQPFSLLHASQQIDPIKAAQGIKDPVDQQKIRDLIKQLGDDAFDKREAADKQPAAMGLAALDLIQKAAAESTDAKVRERRRNWRG